MDCIEANMNMIKRVGREYSWHKYRSKDKDNKV